MKITVAQLRKIIQEEVESNLTEARLSVGDKVMSKPDDGSGIWVIEDLFPDNRTGKMVAKLKLFTPKGGRTTTAFDTTDKLKKLREGFGSRATIVTTGMAQKMIEEYPEPKIQDEIRSFLVNEFEYDQPDEMEAMRSNLEGFLSELSVKDLQTLSKHFGKKYGFWTSSPM